MDTTTLAAAIEHTFLKPDGTSADIERLCEEALRYRFAAVAVNPAEAVRCARILKDSSIRIAVAVGFPLGQNTTATKMAEAQNAIADGATDLDMVINVRALKSGDAGTVRKEIAELVSICKPAKRVSKIILEACYLTDTEKSEVARMARDEGADFVKTSTGFGPSGATVADVRLLRGVVGPGMGVKASGGIRTLAVALALLHAGATRIGTSHSVAILGENFEGGER